MAGNLVHTIDRNSKANNHKNKRIINIYWPLFYEKGL